MISKSCFPLNFHIETNVLVELLKTFKKLRIQLITKNHPKIATKKKVGAKTKTTIIDPNSSNNKFVPILTGFITQFFKNRWFMKHKKEFIHLLASKNKNE